MSLQQFMEAMAGISNGNIQAFAAKFDFSRYKTLCDIGGSTGILSVIVATAHPHTRCVSADHDGHDPARLEPREEDVPHQSGVTMPCRPVARWWRSRTSSTTRRENGFGLLMSRNLLMEFGDAFDFTGADFSR